MGCMLVLLILEHYASFSPAPAPDLEKAYAQQKPDLYTEDPTEQEEGHTALHDAPRDKSLQSSYSFSMSSNRSTIACLAL